ncbi:MAG: flippase [Bacteroidota bacterium]
MAPPVRLLRNYLTLLAGNVAGQLLFFVGLAHLARMLGPAGFGLWNFAQVWMLYLLRGGEFGLEVIGVRETARNPGETPHWIATVVSVRTGLALGLFGAAVLLSAGGLLPEGSASLVLISALALFPMAVLLEWVFEGRQEVGLISAARILKGAVFCAAVLVLVDGSADGELAAFLYVGALAAGSLFVLVAGVRRFGFRPGAFSREKAAQALRMSAPVGIATLLSQYSLLAATLMVGYVLGGEPLGYFTAAHRIVLFLWAYVITSMHRILLPSLSRSFRDAPSDYGRFVERFFRISVLGALPAGLVGALAAGPLMEMLYSARYAESGAVFAILVWAFVLGTTRSIFEIALIAADRQRRYMWGMGLLALLYTILTPLLTIRFGIVGASWAVLLSELGYCIFLVVSFPYLDSRRLAGDAWKPVAAAGIGLAVGILLSPMHGFVRAGAGACVFCLALWAFRGVRREDLDLARTTLGFGRTGV